MKPNTMQIHDQGINSLLGEWDLLYHDHPAKLIFSANLTHGLRCKIQFYGNYSTVHNIKYEDTLKPAEQLSQINVCCKNKSVFFGAYFRDNHYFSAIIKGNQLNGMVVNNNTSGRSPLFGNKID